VTLVRGTTAEAGAGGWQFVEQIAAFGDDCRILHARDAYGHVPRTSGSRRCREFRSQGEGLVLSNHEFPLVREHQFRACAVLRDEGFAFEDAVAGMKSSGAAILGAREDDARYGVDAGDFGSRGHWSQPCACRIRCEPASVDVNFRRRIGLPVLRGCCAL
jgi:hypothetical protein